MNRGYINVGVVGSGTVGGGTLEVLAKNADVIKLRAMEIKVRWLAEKDMSRGQAALEKAGLTDTKLTDDWHQLIDDPETDIVVELIGGTGLSYEILSSALKAGKSAVTANKDLMAVRGGELLALAHDHHADLFFEASVGGGIPVLQSMKENLAANHFSEIIGIVNGTTNFILTMMADTGMDFADALAQAQALGYAEADPTSDVEGIDAARKMAILSSIAYNSRVTLDDVYREGITAITNWDILYAKELGYAVKMLGVSRFDGEKIDVRVHPALLPQDHPLASVRDSYNAVYLTGDAVEHVMLYGRGAGSLPTASAVVGDIICAARNISMGCQNRWGCSCKEMLPIVPTAEMMSKYYLRIQVMDKPGVLASLSAALAKNEVSMHTVMQKRALAEGGAEIVAVTHPAAYGNMMQAIADMEALDCVSDKISYIRVEE